MNYLIPPTVFKENPYQEEWYERDFFHSPDGIKEFPRHHCKRTYLVSEPFIRGRRNAIDVGCRDGEYTRYLHKAFEHTYAFDPQRRKNFPFNVDLSKVTHFNCALGDEEGHIDMYGSTHSPIEGIEAKHVPVFRLDDFELERIDYIKIDVEGFEKKVMMGGLKTIQRDRPLIVIEQNDVTLQGEERGAAKVWLEAQGYKHVATCPRGWDLIMLPNEA